MVDVESKLRLAVMEPLQRMWATRRTDIPLYLDHKINFFG